MIDSRMFDEEGIFQFDQTTHEPSPHLIESSTQCIRNLYEKYANDIYITSKIQHYISIQLPLLIANIEETRQKNMERTNELNNTQETFMNIFLNSNRYYYIHSNEKYFHYNGIHYEETFEDHILHHIVSSISKENSLLVNWKHKTKVSILKKIKDTNILHSIPESSTIQYVLQLCSRFFQSKKQTKFFLSILGDNIFKKNLALIHFINPSIKGLLRELNNRCIEYFNTQCTQTFKFKCHEKHYEMDNKDCRIVPIFDGIDTTLSESFKEHILDILCVAAHYSKRYSSSDDYIKVYNTDDDLSNYVLKLCHTTPEKMLEEFTQEYLYIIGNEDKQVNSSPIDNYILQCNRTDIIGKSDISWKSMLFLWKDYLRVHKYPLNLYQPICKQILTRNLLARHYNEMADMFSGIGSSKMPTINRFLKFWSETIIDDFEDHTELEIDEIWNLFRDWLNRYYNKSKVNLKDGEIIDILRYYYPEIEIENEKFIYKKKCILWDKDVDIDTAMSTIKKTCKDENKNVSIYDAYNYYCKMFKCKLCVSKPYFEKYMDKKYISDAGILILL
jgi:hypothetical protein